MRNGRQPGVALAAHVLQARSGHLFVEVILQLALALYPLVLAEGVHFVHEDLKDHVRVDSVGHADGRLKPGQGLGVVILRVDDPHKRTAAAICAVRLDRGGGGVDVPREVPDLKLEEGRIGNVVLHQLVGGLEEERLVRGHLMEDHLLNR
jgi:hypothetical protein